MKFSHKFWAGALALSVLGSLCLHPLTADAARMTAAEQAAAEAAEAERQAAYDKTIDSNSIENWPQGPQIYAESAIVRKRIQELSYIIRIWIWSIIRPASPRS